MWAYYSKPSLFDHSIHEPKYGLALKLKHKINIAFWNWNTIENITPLNYALDLFSSHVKLSQININTWGNAV